MLSSSVVSGVKVPLQVILSMLLIAASVPLATVMSALEKPATASEKVNVTVGVSPSRRATSESVKAETEGAVLSTMILPELPVGVAVITLPARSCPTDKVKALLSFPSPTAHE